MLNSAFIFSFLVATAISLLYSRSNFRPGGKLAALIRFRMRHVTRMPMRSNDFESELSFRNTEIAFGNKVVEIGKKTRLCCSPVGGTERRVGDERD
jgi:hypothetical protein